MEINYIIIYGDEDTYEVHAETLEEAEEIKQELLDEGYEDIVIQKVRIK